MVNDITDALSIRLHEAFGDGYRIYSETVVQGFTEPCFYILALGPSREPLLGPRNRQQNPFDVMYFPSETGGNAEMHQVADRLFEELEWITLPDDSLMRGADMRYEIQDGVLHFFVEYNGVVQAVTHPEEPMEQAAMQQSVKG